MSICLQCCKNGFCIDADKDVVDCEEFEEME